MDFEWDEAKRAANLAKHRLDFADLALFAWDAAAIRPDLRFHYGEDRFRAFVVDDGRLYSVAFTLRGSAMRVLSFRRANRKERRLYAP